MELVQVETTQQMIEKAALFSNRLKAGDTVHLSGDLGAGKTTFASGILNGLGYQGVVLSPTFSIVESYAFERITVHHFDLYRIESAQELELIGFRDYFTQANIIMIEWPQRAIQMLPTPNYDIHIQQTDLVRSVSICTQ